MSDKYTITLPLFVDCLGSSGIKEVMQNSAIKEREALEQFARYFKKEMNYVGVQYEADNHSDNCIGFLFYQSAVDVVTEVHKTMPCRGFGGCAFSEINNKWVLCWVWLHPFFRNQGNLSRQWKYFVNRFGDFCIESPVAPSMKSFLKKQSGTHCLVKIPTY